MYLTDIQQLPADDQDRSKHVRVMKYCMYKYNFKISAFVEFVLWTVNCELLTVDCGL